jgi:predicted PurR-regulated permease PerM
VTLQRQILIWAVSLAVLIFFLWVFSSILLPFIAGLVLAYFLDPVADSLERLGLPRIAASLLIVVTSILVIVITVMLVAPMLTDQVIRLARDLPEIINALVNRFNTLAPVWIKDALAETEAKVGDSATGIAGQATEWFGTLLATLLTGGLALFNLISLLVVTPIVAFYLLLDWDSMVAKVDSWIPREHVGTVRKLARRIDRSMAGFIRGQSMVCLLLGIFYAAALTFAGLRFGLAIGMIAGFLTFIPYVGALIGGVLAIGVALMQFWPEFWPIAIVAGIFALGQFMEGNFLTPKLVGGSVGLHPVWVMFALFAFGYVFGFVGLLLAVPLAAVAGVLIRFALDQYLGSQLYLGDSRDAPEEMPVAVIKVVPAEKLAAQPAAARKTAKRRKA